jgi:hypothetical protein
MDEFTLMRTASVSITVACTLAIASNALIAPVLTPRFAGGMVLIATFAIYTALGLELLKLWAALTHDAQCPKPFSRAASRLILLGACMAVIQYMGPDCTFEYPILRCTEQTRVARVLSVGGAR